MKRKIVTICGSFKFLEKIQEISEQLEIENGYVVLDVIPHVLNRTLTDAEISLLGELHKAKIDRSDAIFVVNVGGYIGETMKNEIEYAKERGKEILYLE